MRTKALRGLKITDEAAGRVEAVFATLNVVDHDGDITRAGAFEPGAKVRISAYNHASWDGALPVGRGTIAERGDDVVLDGQFFLETSGGRETFEVVKQMAELQEWSYGYDVLEADKTTVDGARVNELRKIKVHEVSPVILGAGVGTRTLAVKRGQRAGKQLAGDIHARLDDAATERWGGEETWAYVRDFDVDEKWAVVAIYDEAAGTRELQRVDFSRAEDGSIELAGEAQEVVAETLYTAKSVGAVTLPVTVTFTKELADQIEVAQRELDSLAVRLSDAVTAEDAKGKSPVDRAAIDRLKSTIAQLDEMVVEPEPDADLVRERARFERSRAITT